MSEVLWAGMQGRMPQHARQGNYLIGCGQGILDLDLICLVATPRYVVVNEDFCSYNSILGYPKMLSCL